MMIPDNREETPAVKVYGTATGQPTAQKSKGDLHVIVSGGDHSSDNSALLKESLLHDNTYQDEDDCETHSSIASSSAHSSRSRTSLPRFIDDSFEQVGWLRHPKVKEQWKVVLASFILMTLGLGLLIAGFVVIASPHTRVGSYVFLIAGVICFIPGAYHFFYIYLAVTGRCGLNLYNMPVFK